MKKQFDDEPGDSMFKLTFRYVYGMSSEEQLAYCQQRLPEGTRASLSARHSARWLSYEIDHLTRLIASGRGYKGFSSELYGNDSVIFSKVKAESFVGKTITIPVKF